MTEITFLHDNNVHVNAEEVFFQYEESADISKLEILEIIKNVENLAQADAAKRFGKAPSSGSINNSRGRWFEMIMAHAVLMAKIKGYEVLKLPSATENACYVDLFAPKDRKKVLSLSLHTSNPDFIIVRVNKKSKTRKFKSFRDFWVAIQEIPGDLDVKDIKVVFSVKTSPRPDRRYQMIHEANTIKTMHLVLGHTPPKYAVLMLESSGTDDVIFKYPVLFLLATGKKTPSIDFKAVAKKYADLMLFLKKQIAL
jgi:hypothetical protein